MGRGNFSELPPQAPQKTVPYGGLLTYAKEVPRTLPRTLPRTHATTHGWYHRHTLGKWARMAQGFASSPYRHA